MRFDRSILGHVGTYPVLHRRGSAARRLRQGRSRAWAADRFDRPARGRDAAVARDRHRHRACDRHQYLADLCRPAPARLWPLMAGTVIGIWLNAGMLSGPYARYGGVVLGVLLVIYAIVGLSKFSFSVARSNEKWIGGIVGLVTGAVSAATGVQVVPSMPFMQAIGMEKDELVQALGVFFTVATLALAFTLTSAGLLSASTALPGAVAMASAFAGMFMGQVVGSRMQPEAFRRWFLIAMILLGLYLTGSAVYNMTAS